MSFWIDIKYAARLLLKKPLFALTSILIVAVGLGLTVYTYSMLNSLVFKPMTLNGDQPIYAIEAQFDHNHLFRRPADPFDLERVKKEIDAVDDIGFYQDGTALFQDIEGKSGTVKFNASYVSWNVFEFASTPPLYGRGFRESDQQKGAEPVVMLSYEIWRDYFDSNEKVVNSLLTVEGEKMRVVGVMPQGFAFPMTAQAWLLLPPEFINAVERSGRSVLGFMKLKEGRDFSEFEQELERLNPLIIQDIPEDFIWRVSDNGEYLSVQPYKKASITQYYSIFIAMFIVVFLILMLACINIGNLLLARVNERIKEVAIRVALGIPRVRLVWQMLWESIFICVIGGFFAILVAGWGLEITNGVFDAAYAVDQQKPFWWTLALDSHAVTALILTVIFMIAITGLIPAWRALTGDFNAILRDGTRGALGKKAAQASKALVISEILLSCVVLVIATILLYTSYASAHADYGVDTDNRITARLELPILAYAHPGREAPEEEQRKAGFKRSDFYYQLKEKMEALPNVEGVAFMSQFPGSGEGTSHFEIEGRAAEVYNENPYSNNEIVSRDSWRVVGMNIVDGRDFDYRDSEPGVLSIIINESIAREFFPNGDAVGKRVRRVNSRGTGDWNTIIGVVSDTFHGSAMRSSSASYNSYHVFDAFAPTRINVAVHYTGRQALAEKALRETIIEIDPRVAAFHVQTYEELIYQPMILVSAVSKIFLLCGVVAVFLAASGIYAVASNGVTQRTQEIGVRRALGATDSMVMRLFMKQAAVQLALGLLFGLGLSVWIIDMMTDTLVMNQVSYYIGFVFIPALIVAMVLMATYIPTRRVVLMEPSNALHHD
ncbi:MAG: FtsX-like permease family protein [Psychrobium sp.]